MSESNEKKTTAESKTEKDSASPKKQKDTKISKSWLMPLIVLLVIFIGGGYSGWQQYKQQQSRNANKFSQLSEQIDKISRAQKYQADDQQTQLDELSEKQTEINRNFAALLKSSAHLKNDWLLAEAEYLIKLANHRLLLEKDITTAIAAMQAADERLREVADPALIEVRKVILEQTQMLRAIEQPDLTGMALQISALKKQIPQLAMKTPDPATVLQRAKQPSSASRVKSWNELPAAMWQDLKGLITIRNHSQAVQPLIPPEQHYFLKQNLNLQLEQARLSLLKGNNDLYTDSLKTATDWIETHFDVEHQNTQSLLKGIKSLSGLNIAPVIPDISQSYKVLQQYRVKGFVPKEEKAKQPDTQETKPEQVEAPEKQPETNEPGTPKPDAADEVKL